MLESLPDVFVPATEWEWAVMERCIEITVVPPPRLASLTALAPAFNSEVFAFLASGQNRIVS